MTSHRTRWFGRDIDKYTDGDGTTAAHPGNVKRVFRRVIPEEYNLVASLAEDGNHYPVLDIDIPCRYVKSSTKGHGHLYFDGLSLTWEQYLILLDALKNAGIIETAYYNHSVRQQKTLVRPEHARKVITDRKARAVKDPRPVGWGLGYVSTAWPSGEVPF